MYTIKQAAARAGVSVPVLRAWERRYGVVQPTRTPSGYRVYDERAIARVRAMRRLVDEGRSPSTAPARVNASDETELAALTAQQAAAEARALEPDSGAAGDRVGSAAAALDQAGVEEALDEMFAAGSFETVVQRHVMPALHALGAAWAEGRVDVAAEHAASHAVLRRLSAA